MKALFTHEDITLIKRTLWHRYFNVLKTPVIIHAYKQENKPAAQQICFCQDFADEHADF